MLKEVIATGKDITEAKENARAALGAGPLDDVNFEIIHLGSRGIFGIFKTKPAQVKATMEIPEPHERKRNERPRRENNAPEATEGGENTGANRNSKPRNKKHKKTNSENKRENKPQNEAPAAPKTQAIPENELRMERREVAEGEDMSYEFVKTLLADIELDAEAELYACEDGTRRITIVGNDASVLIGHHGDTLDALQYLANLASARKNIHGERDKSRVTIDIEGYRAKREETLRALARRMAAKALRNKRSVMLEPMSAYERRIIHSEIQNIEGVSTNSIGSDNNRKIVIFLTDKKPEGIFEEKVPETPLVEEFAKDEMDNSSEVLGNLDAYTTADEIETDVTAVEATRTAEDILEEDDFDVK